MSRARDLADSADLNFDDGTLVIDSGNNRVGIGTSSPDALLHLAAHPDSASLRFEATDTTINPGQYYGRLEFEGNDTGTSASGIRARIDALSTGGNGESALVFNTSGIGADSDNEAARIDSSGDLHIGKTATNFAVTGATLKNDGTVQFTRDGDQVALFNRLTSDGTILDLRKDGTTVGSITVSGDEIIFGTPDGSGCGLRFDGDNRIIKPDDGSGTLIDSAIDIGNSSNRFKDLYLSGGVYLGGTGSANYLDDYEEGTWTPTLDSNLGDSVDAYDSRQGTYTKIGEKVIATGYIDVNTKGTVTGTVMRISGLPFAPVNNVLFQASAIGYWHNINIGTATPLISVYGNNTFGYLFYTSSNVGSNQITPSQITDATQIAVTMIYETDA